MGDGFEGFGKADRRQSSGESSAAAIESLFPNEMADFLGLSGGEQRVMASEIISRLLLLHRVPKEGDGALFALAVRPRDRERFVRHILMGDLGAAADMLDEFIERGVPPKQLLLELLPDAARSLGSMWEREEASFSDVTLALCSLHRLLRERKWREGRDEDIVECASSVLVATLEGEQHIFGAMIAAEVFRDAGWRVTTMAGAPADEVIGRLTSSSFDVLGISAATIGNSETAAAELRAFRAASLNRDLKIIVGGHAFAEEDDLAARIGADAAVGDASVAPLLASGLHQGA